MGCRLGGINTLRPRQNGRHFPDDIFRCIFLNENVQISIKISLKFVPKGPINNIPALVQIMAWHRPGDKPLSEPMMVSLLTHICVTRPQWTTNTGILLIRTLGTNFSDILSEIHTFSFNACENIVCEMAEISSRPVCVNTHRLMILLTITPCQHMH